jgi:hypothetical protein
VYKNYIDKPQMDLLGELVASGPENYERVRCRRFGLALEWFSSVLGRTIYCGEVCYESRKNFRSNAEFDEFKSANQISRRVLFVFLNRPVVDIVRVFGDDPGLFLSDNFDCSGADIVVFAFNHSDVKIRKSKVFFLKSKQVLMYDLIERRKLLVDKLTLQVSCRLSN